jgi:hypothetical protein
MASKRPAAKAQWQAKDLVVCIFLIRVNSDYVRRGNGCKCKKYASLSKYLAGLQAFFANLGPGNIEIAVWPGGHVAGCG